MRIVDVTDPQMVRALAHPLRRQVLASLRGRVASPRELADELGRGLGTVSYHVRQLAEAGLVELVRTEPRRGATAHFYTATGRNHVSDEVWDDLPAGTRHAVARSWLRQVVAETAAAIEDGDLPSEPHASILHLERLVLALDDVARSELAEAVEALHAHALRLEDDSRRRGGGGGRPVHLVLMAFPGAANPGGRGPDGAT